MALQNAPGASRTDSKPAVQKEVYNTEEAAAYLGMSVRALRELAARRVIEHYKPGKRLFFKHSALMAYLEQGRVKTTAELDAEAARYIQKGGVL